MNIVFQNYKLLNPSLSGFIGPPRVDDMPSFSFRNSDQYQNNKIQNPNSTTILFYLQPFVIRSYAFFKTFVSGVQRS